MEFVVDVDCIFMFLFFSENIAQAEVDEYHRQLCSRPHMINTALHNNVAKTNEVKNTKRIIKKTRVSSTFMSEIKVFSNSSKLRTF